MAETQFDPLNPAAWFQGRVGMVTGASSGMGFEIAVLLGRAGVKVGVGYRGNRDGAEQAVRRIVEAGGQALALQADVSRTRDVQRMFDELARQFGDRLDLLVNNAGDWMDKLPIADCPDEQWDRMFDVNARSVFLCCRHAAKKMIAQGDGSILNIGSVAGHIGGGGGTVPYAAAKSAVHTFTKGLARELGPDIRVNTIAPGMIDTPMLEGRVGPEARDRLIAAMPLKRFGAPAEIATAALFVLSPAASYMTGETIEVNGGLNMR